MNESFDFTANSKSSSVSSSSVEIHTYQSAAHFVFQPGAHLFWVGVNACEYTKIVREISKKIRLKTGNMHYTRGIVQ